MKNIVLILLLILPFGLKSQSLLLKIINPTVTGNQVVYDVCVEDFVDVIALQFVISYDTSVLKFNTVQNIIIPTMSLDGNFYADSAGNLFNVWLDLSVKGVTLEDGEILYQVVFDMVNDTFGTVCFNQDSIPMEVVREDNVEYSVYVIDDCHEKPFLFDDNTTGVENVGQTYGLDVYTFNQNNISFSLKESKELGFQLYELNGSLVRSFPKTNYLTGHHSLHVNSSLDSGIYIFVAVINDQKTGFRIYYSD
ncbi:MAG TPA: hypothetical protein VJ184_03475 [Chryseolinea sp.]|nr:hypothetical protein [Chryseolinea sp.]